MAFRQQLTARQKILERECAAAIQRIRDRRAIREAEGDRKWFLECCNRYPNALADLAKGEAR